MIKLNLISCILLNLSNPGISFDGGGGGGGGVKCHLMSENGCRCTQNVSNIASWMGLNFGSS